MKARVIGYIFLSLAFALTLTVSARPGGIDRRPAHQKKNLNKPVKLIGAIHCCPVKSRRESVG
jgi:hypothetical protein